MMENTNWIAVIVATIVAFVIGGAYYGALAKPWMRAARIDPSKPMKMTPAMIATSLGMEFIMALMTSGVLFHIYAGAATLRQGLIAGVLLWLGFIVPTLSINQRYEGYGWDLTLIDAGHWLLVMLAIGATITLIG